MTEAQKGALSRETSEKVEQVEELNARSRKYNLPERVGSGTLEPFWIAITYPSPCRARTHLLPQVRARAFLSLKGRGEKASSGSHQ